MENFPNGLESKQTPERLKTILDFESFQTERGSVYNILPDGRVQRIKTILDDPNYRGLDAGQKKEQAPSDIILFFDSKKTGGYLEDLDAVNAHTDKTTRESIDVGTYKKINDTTYQLVKNNLDIDGDFVFVRVNKDDSFKLKEVFSFEELKEFQDRTMKPENKGLGILIPSAAGNITNLPRAGFNTFDYRYSSNGTIQMHNGNKVVSIKKRVAPAATQPKEPIVVAVPENPTTENSIREDGRSLFNDTERSVIENTVTKFADLRNEFRKRYENRNTHFFEDADLHEIDSISTDFETAQTLEDMSNAIRTLPAVLDHMLNSGGMHERINDDHANLDQLSYFLGSLREKLLDTANVLNQSETENSPRQDIVRDLRISSEMLDQLRQKVNSYHQSV